MSHVLVDNITNREGGAIGISSGAVVTGVVTATSFVGDGSGLSGIDATALKDSGGSVKVQGNTSGIIVTGISTFSSNVSIGGTLIYDDVTNIDSVGVVTARAGIKIGAGQSVSAVSGIVTYYGDGSQLSGVESGVANFVASGNIANGATVIIKTDGTVGIVTTTVAAQTSGTPVTFNSGTTGLGQYSATFDSTNNKVVIAYNDSNNGKAIVGTVNSSNNTISFGSEVTFVSSTNYGRYYTTFDSNSGKVVIAYTDPDNSDYGTAIVGTVSGTSISFGTKVAFNSGDTQDIAATFDSTNNKVIIAYRDGGNSSAGTVRVGTVSGTSISFGSESVFNSTYSSNIGVAHDSTNNKIVIAFRDESNSSNRGAAIVGTVSGTSITFGSLVRINSSNSQGYYHNVVHDSNSGKTVVVFRDSNISSKGVAYVGTVSGTSISFGSAVVFNNGATNDPAAVFDSNANQILIAFQDDSDSDEPTTAIAGTVSGTSITFGSKLKMDTADGYRTGIAFDSNADRTVVVFQDADNSNNGRVVIYQQPTLSTNLTTENYIGIAAEAISNGATGKINVLTGTNTGQTGLTTALKYFVQNSGGISTTASSPSVVAGTAISDTKIVVR